LRTERKCDSPTSRDYATRGDFCRIFQEDMQSLYQLAFLLTGNHADAEQCFVAGIEDALNEDAVFEDRARNWSRRAVIKNAIRMIASAAARSYGQPDHCAEAEDESAPCTTIGAVAQLATLDRIVFVMTVLERYSEWECAALLGCSARDVHQARIRALQQLPAFYPAFPLASAENHHRATERPEREHERSRS
jgi:DNA-directed RNA polymerase specialized sigma24 family protein